MTASTSALGVTATSPRGRHQAARRLCTRVHGVDQVTVSPDPDRQGPRKGILMLRLSLIGNCRPAPCARTLPAGSVRPAADTDDQDLALARARTTTQIA